MKCCLNVSNIHLKLRSDFSTQFQLCCFKVLRCGWLWCSRPQNLYSDICGRFQWPLRAGGAVSRARVSQQVRAEHQNHQEDLEPNLRRVFWIVRLCVHAYECGHKTDRAVCWCSCLRVCVRACVISAGASGMRGLWENRIVRPFQTAITLRGNKRHRVVIQQIVERLLKTDNNNKSDTKTVLLLNTPC